ncbi:MAG: glycosyltransferase family 4 protein [Rudaea sp.]
MGRAIGFGSWRTPGSGPVTSRPRLAIVSTGIRRDLLDPLKYLTAFEVTHLYRSESYGDLTAEDRPPGLVRYYSPLDLYRRLVLARPAIIQGVEPFSFALQPYLWACRLAAARTGASLLAVTLENRPLEVKFGRPAAWLLRMILRVFFTRVCLAIALNEGSLRNLISCGVPPERIKRLMWGTWGVDLEEFSPATGRAEPGATVLFAGRLVPEKGILVLFNAWPAVCSAVPGATLLIAGDGKTRAEVQARARTLPGIVLLGNVKNRDMPALFRRAAVFVMPSSTTSKWEEQVGMSALQAMACGVPVVATRSGAIPEYMPDGIAGSLVPENNSTALSSALVQFLLDHERRAETGRLAHAFAAANYDARANIRRAEQAVQESCVARRI